MQKIERLPLGKLEQKKLDDLSLEVARSKDPKATATKLWEKLDRRLKSEVQAVLARMSSGLERCMYCEDSQGTDIEHFRPKSAYPDHAFSWLNYLLACTRCNSNHKRTLFPLGSDGDALLIDPTVDDPSAHLQLTPTTGLYVGIDAKGDATIGVCGLNRDVCASGRSNAWTAIEYLIPSYVKALESGYSDKAFKILKVLREYPFQSVRVAMVKVFSEAQDPGLLLSAEVISAFREYPELK
ncbi:hypothetical protein [Herbidospora daliensis]|uniref:hypothetical protein n=1 Tax=Herbidospora daliensis TaxID=295585 RepID=UPI000A8D328F|nr:hypothetical protein [Herbidospora daliensis]